MYNRFNGYSQCNVSYAPFYVCNESSAMTSIKYFKVKAKVSKYNWIKDISQSTHSWKQTHSSLIFIKKMDSFPATRHLERAENDF